MLDDLNGMQMLVAGITIGVVAAYLIVATYLLIGRAAAKARLAEFFERYGALKGVDYYTNTAIDIDDEEIRRELTVATEQYAALLADRERTLDAILAKAQPKE